MTGTLYINARFLTQQLSGMQRYAEEIVRGIDELLAKDRAQVPFEQVVALLPNVDHRDPHWKHVALRPTGRLRGHAWEQFELARLARHGTLLNLMAAGPLMHGKSALVVHDAAIFAHPEHFSVAYRKLHQFLRPRLVRKAWRLFTISDFSRRELARYCAVEPSRFGIIGDSAEHILRVDPDPTVLSRNGLEPGRYVLLVGNQSPNKNLALAVRAWERLGRHDFWLVMAGGGSKAVFGSVGKVDGERVKALGRVTDEELRSLYEQAALFLFPSRYEGFGVPPLEAMTLGCPVLSSDSSAMPEVLGSAARYFRCDDEDDLVRALGSGLDDIAAGRWNGANGPARAAHYDWDDNVRSLLSAIAD